MLIAPPPPTIGTMAPMMHPMMLAAGPGGPIPIHFQQPPQQLPPHITLQPTEQRFEEIDEAPEKRQKERRNSGERRDRRDRSRSKDRNRRKDRDRERDRGSNSSKRDRSSGRRERSPRRRRTPSPDSDEDWKDLLGGDAHHHRTAM